MKKLIFPFTILLILSIGCQQNNPQPNPSPTPPPTPTPIVNYGIQYVGSVYDSVDVMYRLMGNTQAITAYDTNSFELTYIPGSIGSPDSIHLEFNINKPFELKVVTVPLYSSNESYHTYTFKDDNFQIDVAEQTDGRKKSTVHYIHYNDAMTEFEEYIAIQCLSN